MTRHSGVDPNSARYFQHVDPRRFFTVAEPVNLILIVLTLILFWKDSVKIRVYFATSLALYAAIVILTLGYFVPRDLILFTSSIPDHIEEIKMAVAQWSHMNWLRSLLGLVGVLFSFIGLDTYYKSRTT